MSKALYAGINSLARKVKKMYIGIEGVARKVKKAYIGINGIARLFFAGGGAPVYAGRTTSSQRIGGEGVCADIGKYGVIVSPIATGEANIDGNMYAVDNELTVTVQSITNRHHDGDVAPGNEGAIFGGGGDTFASSSVAEWLDSELSFTPVQNLPSPSHGCDSGVTPSFGIFVGGQAGGAASLNQDVTAYELSTRAQTILSDYPWPHMNGAASSTKNHLVIYGGREKPGVGGSIPMQCVAYSDDLTTIDLTSALSEIPGNYDASGATADYGAVFAGGMAPPSSRSLKNVVVYDDALTMTQLENLDASGWLMGAFGLGESAFFGGGISGNTSSYNARTQDVYEYDSDMTKSRHQSVFSRGRSQINSFTIGQEIGAFAGGSIRDREWSKEIDYYTLE